MRRSLVLLLVASALWFGPHAVADPREFLFRNETVCDSDGVFCFRGTLSYDPNPRLLRLSARVQRAPGPGLLRIRLSGTNRLGDRYFAAFEVPVRGHYSEIINHKMIPDYPDVEGWVVEQLEFIAD